MCEEKTVRRDVYTYAYCSGKGNSLWDSKTEEQAAKIVLAG